MNFVDIRNALPKNPDPQIKYPVRKALITGIVIHHSGTNPNEGAVDFAKWHISHWDWPGISYHYVITASGEVQFTLSHDLVGYHCKDNNTWTLGICLCGSFMKGVSPTVQQVMATKELIARLKEDIPTIKGIIGHKELVSTDCPGDLWFSWREALYTPRGGDIEVVTRALNEYRLVLQAIAKEVAKLP